MWIVYVNLGHKKSIYHVFWEESQVLSNMTWLIHNAGVNSLLLNGRECLLWLVQRGGEIVYGEWNSAISSRILWFVIQEFCLVARSFNSCFCLSSWHASCLDLITHHSLKTLFNKFAHREHDSEPLSKHQENPWKLHKLCCTDPCVMCCMRAHVCMWTHMMNVCVHSVFCICMTTSITEYSNLTCW